MGTFFRSYDTFGAISLKVVWVMMHDFLLGFMIPLLLVGGGFMVPDA